MHATNVPYEDEDWEQTGESGENDCHIVADSDSEESATPVERFDVHKGEHADVKITLHEESNRASIEHVSVRSVRDWL